MLDKIEKARSRKHLLVMALRFLWCYVHGYRPVPGYTVVDKDGDRIYIAMELER